jgi:methylthioribulose-1-phosphate dehydratase
VRCWAPGFTDGCGLDFRNDVGFSEKDPNIKVKKTPNNLRRPARNDSYKSVAAELAEIGRGFYARGWVSGTSGNFSAVLHREPLRLAITSTGVDKGRLTANQILEIDESAVAFRGEGRPSAETPLHFAIIRSKAAGAVLHTHSVWSTVLSVWHAAEKGVPIKGYEMLKGLQGVRTHEHREWLPILENSQDMTKLSQAVADAIRDYPEAHGFLLCGHGLYTWGANLPEAKRHIEILEFLMETLVRTRGAGRLD